MQPSDSPDDDSSPPASPAPDLTAQFQRWAQHVNDASPIQPVEDEPPPDTRKKSIRASGRRKGR